MIIDPPIDKLVEKSGCKYALVGMIAKRAKFLADKRSEMVNASGRTAISLASQEAYEGKIRMESED